VFTPHRQPNIAVYRDRVGKNALQAGDTGRNKGWQKDNTHSTHGGVALRDYTVAVEAHFWRRHNLVEPANRINRKQIVNIPNEHVPIEVGVTARNSVAT